MSTIYVKVVDEIVTETWGTPEPGLFEVPAGTRTFDAYVDGVVYQNPAGTNQGWRAAGVWTWGGLDLNNNPVWIVNQTLFTPILFDKISSLRDEYLQRRHEYTTVALESGYFKNDQQTINAVAAYNRAVNAKNDDSYNVDFKAKDISDNDIYVNLTGADIKNLGDSLTDRMKAAFDAENTVRGAHAVTPFTRIQDALDAFEEEVA